MACLGCLTTCVQHKEGIAEYMCAHYMVARPPEAEASGHAKADAWNTAIMSNNLNS